MKLLHTLLCAVAFVVSSGSSVFAAPPPIVWGNATTIAGDSDVTTEGTLAYAYNFGSASSAVSTTINGVTFSPAVISLGTASIAFGNLTVSESPGFLYYQDGLGTPSNPYNLLNTSYKSLLQGAVVASNPVTITVTLGGLTIGQEYVVQVWASNASNIVATWDDAPLQSVIVSSTSPYSVTLDTNTTNLVGGLGQFSIGRFTALATTQLFTLEGGAGSQPLMSGLQLRAVPEPSTVGLGVAGTALLAWAIRRRRA